MKPSLCFLEESEVWEIHQASLEMLSQTGVRVKSQQARELLYANGGEVCGDIVRLPVPMVEGAVARIRPDLRLGARGKDRGLEPYRLSRPLIGPNGISPFTKDWRTGQVRYATLDDLRDFAVVCDYFDEVGFFGAVVSPGDVPPQTQEIQSLYTSFVHTSKHVQGVCSTRRTAYWQVKLAQALAGGEKQLRQNPVFSAQISPMSPLTIGGIEADSIILMAEKGIPVSPYATPLTGATAPVTLAGCLALGNAENLAMLTLIKSVSGDGQMIYSADTGVPSHSTGVINYDAPEYRLLAMGNQQLARFYGLPSCVAHDSSEELPCGRASWDLCRLAIVRNLMTGTDLSAWLGSKDSTLTSSLVDLVVDIDLLKEAAQFCEEILMNENFSAVEYVSGLVAGGGRFPGPDTPPPRPRFVSPLRELCWEQALVERCREIIGDILHTHRPAPIDGETHREMEEILRHAQEDLLRGERDG